MFIDGHIPISLIEKAFRASEENAGASTCFIGKVRADKKNGIKVQSIEFTAQKEIALRIASEIIEFSKEKMGIINAEIWHSLGLIYTGEPCFLVIVTGKHRKESFEALQYIVDEVKKLCPIFGKEFFNDGTYQWKKVKELTNTKE